MSNFLFETLKIQAEKRDAVPKGSYLFHVDDCIDRLYVVEQGLIELTRYQEDGAQITLQRAVAGDILAEASMYSDKYHCDAIVSVPSVVLSISKKAMRHALKSPSFALLWEEHLARETQRARFRSELLCRKTVAARLDGWLGWPDNDLPPKGKWKDLALELAVSPEALYREISRRRRRQTQVRATTG